MSPKNRRRVPFGAYLKFYPTWESPSNTTSVTTSLPHTGHHLGNAWYIRQLVSRLKSLPPIESVGAPRHPTGLGVTEASHQHSSVSTWVLALQVGEICLLLYKRLNSMVLSSPFRKSISPRTSHYEHILPVAYENIPNWFFGCWSTAWMERSNFQRARKLMAVSDLMRRTSLQTTPGCQSINLAGSSTIIFQLEVTLTADRVM